MSGKKETYKLFNLPWYYFAIFAVLVLIATYTGCLLYTSTRANRGCLRWGGTGTDSAIENSGSFLLGIAA